MKRWEVWIGFGVSALLLAASWKGWLPFDWKETLGFVTGVACVYLVILEQVWNFPVGIVNNLFFLALFLEKRLYGDSVLQAVYIALGFQGWRYWLYGGRNRTSLPLNRASPQLLLVVGILALLSTFAMTPLLRVIHGAYPFLDALTTALSLGAQYLLNRKALENWYFWILADVIYIYLYVLKGLQLTALLYFIFLILCVAGLIQWQRILRTPVLPIAGPATGPMGGEAQPSYSEENRNRG